MANVADKPRPIELCMERMGSASAERYVRCTAQVGRELGLALGIDGRILWCEQSGVGCEIWVSADARLMAYCPAGTPPTTLYRAGRVLELPREHPVVLRHHDELELSATRFRVHVHGVAERAHAPEIVRTLARAAATLALAVAGTAGCASPLKTTTDATAARPDAGDTSADSATIIHLPVSDADAGTDAQTLADGQSGDWAGSPIDGASREAAAPADAPIEVLEFPPALP
jgi:hypothetical protein